MIVITKIILWLPTPVHQQLTIKEFFSIGFKNLSFWVNQNKNTQKAKNNNNKKKQTQTNKNSPVTARRASRIYDVKGLLKKSG